MVTFVFVTVISPDVSVFKCRNAEFIAYACDVDALFIIATSMLLLLAVDDELAVDELDNSLDTNLAVVVVVVVLLYLPVAG